MHAISIGDAPVVYEQFIKYFQQYKDYLGDIIRHHDIGGGGQAAPVPNSFYEGFGEVHSIEKKMGYGEALILKIQNSYRLLKIQQNEQKNGKI